MLLESHMELFHHIQPPYRPFKNTEALYCQNLAHSENNMFIILIIMYILDNNTTKYILCHKLLQMEVIWILSNNMSYIESKQLASIIL